MKQAASSAAAHAPSGISGRACSQREGAGGGPVGVGIGWSGVRQPSLSQSYSSGDGGSTLAGDGPHGAQPMAAGSFTGVLGVTKPSAQTGSASSKRLASLTLLSLDVQRCRSSYDVSEPQSHSRGRLPSRLRHGFVPARSTRSGR